MSTDSIDTKIRIEDASRRLHAPVKHHTSDRQFVDAAETDEADSTEKKARASRRMERDVCEGRPFPFFRSSSAMKPLNLNGTDMDVKTFLDKFKALVKKNRWIDAQKLAQLQNQLREPASVIM